MYYYSELVSEERYLAWLQLSKLQVSTETFCKFIRESIANVKDVTLDDGRCTIHFDDYFIVRDKERIYLGFLDTIIEGVPAPHKQSNNLLQTNFGFFTIDTVWPSVAEYYREKYSTRD